jgi:hypothetical protein
VAQVYQAGRAVRESTGTNDKAKSRRLLKEWDGQIAEGEVIPKLVKATCDEVSTERPEGRGTAVVRQSSDHSSTISGIASNRAFMSGP